MNSDKTCQKELNLALHRKLLGRESVNCLYHQFALTEGKLWIIHCMAIEDALLSTTPGDIPKATLFSFRRGVRIVDARESLHRPYIQNCLSDHRNGERSFLYWCTITPTAFGHLDLFDFGVD